MLRFKVGFEQDCVVAGYGGDDKKLMELYVQISLKGRASERFLCFLSSQAP